MSDYDTDMYITKLRERIEELEKRCSDEFLWVDELPDECDFEVFAHIDKDYDAAVEWFRTSHIITDGQIDAAWEYVVGCEDGSDEQRWMLLALNKLGIERCDGCNGTGRGETEHAGALGEFEWVCDDCNGKGWSRHE